MDISHNTLKSWKLECQGESSLCWAKVMEQWLSDGGTLEYPDTWEGLQALLGDLELSNIGEKLRRAVADYRKYC